MARGRPRQVSGLHDNTSPDATIPDAADVARLLALSDERDQWQHVGHDRERQAYERGRLDGIEIGRSLEAAERDAEWARIAKPIAKGGPTFAELQERRRGGAAA